MYTPLKKNIWYEIQKHMVRLKEHMVRDKKTYGTKAANEREEAKSRGKQRKRR